jgi:hypothetical protein
VELLDFDDALVENDVLDHQAGDFEDARSGVEAGLADQKVQFLDIATASRAGPVFR